MPGQAGIGLQLEALPLMIFLSLSLDGAISTGWGGSDLAIPGPQFPQEPFATSGLNFLTVCAVGGDCNFVFSVHMPKTF